MPTFVTMWHRFDADEVTMVCVVYIATYAVFTYPIPDCKYGFNFLNAYLASKANEMACYICCSYKVFYAGGNVNHAGKICDHIRFGGKYGSWSY